MIIVYWIMHVLWYREELNLAISHAPPCVDAQCHNAWIIIYIFIIIIIIYYILLFFIYKYLYYVYIQLQF